MTSEKIDLRNLDKSDWPTYRFDEIAQHISERVDPNNTDLETYIGLEHIDSESLHIRLFGTPDDVNGTKLKFYKGDIIFGRRRAYQRKAGIATMDGFCSAHALVLRANPEVIDPQLFPFFIHSDLFMNRAVDISVGSLSPTINWGTLKHQEFRLPPINTQAKLAKLLWTNEELDRNSNKLKVKLEVFRKCYFQDALFKHSGTRSNFGYVTARFPSVLLGTAINSLDYGISSSLAKKGTLPVLRMNNLVDGELDYSDLKYAKGELKVSSDLMLKRGDVLFNRVNSFELVGKTSLFKASRECTFASYLIRIRLDESKIRSDFLSQYMNSDIGLWKLRRYRTPGVNQSNINAQSLRKLPVPLPRIETQDEIMSTVGKLASSENETDIAIEKTKAVRKSILESIF